ncbi:hypothetical protein [Roseospira navarrensis]|uniref:Uncharacterized protein n=1 Tax=Roseospira navarrensis TaxID=140058 RepID=A0A7X1ZHJ1_9PROT|nr:hypothetical protein [Roseospira navarrensis]MQX37607.1 hypothetical protein [Roseospira navarrensis]
MREYREARVTDEPDITGVLVGRLDAALDGEIGGLVWSSTIVRAPRKTPFGRNRYQFFSMA